MTDEATTPLVLACSDCSCVHDLETETMPRRGACWFCGRTEPGLTVARVLRVVPILPSLPKTPAEWLEWALRSQVPLVRPGKYLVEWVVAQPPAVVPALEVRLRVETRREDQHLVSYRARLVYPTERLCGWVDGQDTSAWLKSAQWVSTEMVQRAVDELREEVERQEALRNER